MSKSGKPNMCRKGLHDMNDPENVYEWIGCDGLHRRTCRPCKLLSSKRWSQMSITKKRSEEMRRRVDKRPIFQTEIYLQIVIDDEVLPKPHRMTRANEYRRTHRDPEPGEVVG